MISAFRSHQTRFAAGPNLTPLVDVALVVLIFLMLAGSFGGATHFLVGKLRSPGHRPAIGQPALASLDLFVEPYGEGVLVRGSEVTATSDMTLLRRELRLKSDEMFAGGVDRATVPVVLHPARSVRYGQLMAVYDAVEGARFSYISMARAN